MVSTRSLIAAANDELVDHPVGRAGVEVGEMARREGSHLSTS